MPDAPPDPRDPSPEEAIFLAVSEQPAGPARQALLERMCAGNTAVRRRVEALLEATAAKPGFMDQTPRAPATGALAAVGDAESAGAMIGPYRLREKLGEGGFGTVWKAEQTAPIRRDVALKVIRRDLADPEIIARFESERQALALMEHPHIASVLDAGTTAAGRPYFVMEWVRGRNLTSYCRTRRPPLRDRLEIFLQICQAIQHAHLKGILHRDLKPANVLVMEVDGSPMVKVIDFGIAKALGSHSDAAVVARFMNGHTQGLSILGTPQYMSPEQAGSSPDIDTRSDIYSLGVILYELLTGHTPLSAETLRNAAVDEILRLIREHEPPRPSTQVLKASPQYEDLPPAALRKSLSGDLDWIALKALEKDRERRFTSVADLAEDLRAYMADKPVRACPPSLRYRLRKFTRRHRTMVAAASMVVFTILAALVVSVTAYVRERRALAAETEAHARARQVLDFLANLLDDQASLVSKGKNPEALRLALDQSAASLSLLEKDPEATDRVATLLARIYDRLGDSSFTLPMAKHQLQILRRAYGDDDPRTLEAQVRYGSRLVQAGQPIEGADLLGQVVAAFERTGRGGTLNHLLARKEALHALAFTRIPTPEKLEQELEALRADQERLLPTPENQMAFLHYQADVFYHARAFEKAEPLLHQLLKGPVPMPTEHSLIIQSLVRLGSIQRELGRPAECYRYFNEAIEKDTAVRGPNYHYLAERYTLLGAAHLQDGHADEAMAAAKEAIRIAHVNGDHVKMPGLLRNAADVAIGFKNHEAALAWLDQSLEMLAHGSAPWLSNSTRRIFALVSLQRWDDAAAALKKLLPDAQADTAPRLAPLACMDMLRSCRMLAAQTPPRVPAEMEHAWRTLGMRGARMRARELQPDQPTSSFTLRDMLPLARLCRQRGAADECRALAQLVVELAGPEPTHAPVREEALALITESGAPPRPGE